MMHSQIVCSISATLLRHTQEKRSFERSRQGRRKREAAAYKAMCGPPPENVSLVINSQADTKFHETILWMDRSASPYATSKR